MGRRSTGDGAPSISDSDSAGVSSDGSLSSFASGMCTSETFHVVGADKIDIAAVECPMLSFGMR